MGDTFVIVSVFAALITMIVAGIFGLITSIRMILDMFKKR